jgi:hypothetical protein
MYPLGIEEGEVRGQFFIERGDIVKEEVGMEIDKLILNRPIEAFTVCIHLRSTGVRVVVGNTLLLEECAHMLFKLGTIVSEGSMHGVRKEVLYEEKELCCSP